MSDFSNYAAKLRFFLETAKQKWEKVVFSLYSDYERCFNCQTTMGYAPIISVPHHGNAFHDIDDGTRFSVEKTRRLTFLWINRFAVWGLLCNFGCKLNSNDHDSS